MSLKVMKAEIEKTLTAQVALFAAGPYKVGLYKNDYTPGDEDDISDITPADFGGYSGLQNLTSWGSIVWADPDATFTHSPVTWTASGSSSNTIHGYYVVDGTGALAWAERRGDSGVSVGASGQNYVVTPQYGRRSRF